MQRRAQWQGSDSTTICCVRWLQLCYAAWLEWGRGWPQRCDWKWIANSWIGLVIMRRGGFERNVYFQLVIIHIVFEELLLDVWVGDLKANEHCQRLHKELTGWDLLFQGSDDLVAVERVWRAEGVNTLSDHLLLLKVDAIFQQLTNLRQEEFGEDVASLVRVLL